MNRKAISKGRAERRVLFDFRKAVSSWLLRLGRIFLSADCSRGIRSARCTVHESAIHG